MDDYPILVERFPSGTTTDMGCNECGHWWHVSDPETFMQMFDHGVCPRCQSMQIQGRYEEAAKCPGCGRLDLELDASGPLKGCCSRRCMLQHEYAQSLSERVA